MAICASSTKAHHHTFIQCIEIFDLIMLRVEDIFVFVKISRRVHSLLRRGSLSFRFPLMLSVIKKFILKVCVIVKQILLHFFIL